MLRTVADANRRLRPSSHPRGDRDRGGVGRDGELLTRGWSVDEAAGERLAEARRRLATYWGDPILIRGERYEFGRCSCLVAGDFDGIAAWTAAGPKTAELVAINAFTSRRGVGTALLTALAERLRPGFGRLRLGTTNDDLDALRFYQRRGFRLDAIRPGAVAEARRLKPSIPELGDYGIPIRDEIDLVLDL